MPSQVDPVSGDEYQTIYVQVINAASVFQKDKLEWPDPKDEKHKDDPPKSFRLHVHGYDELGRRVRPVFEVPDCEEIQLAIHNEHVKDPETKRIIYSGRLVQVMEKDLGNFPKWVGHPLVQDSPVDVVRKIREIQVQQKIGDKVLGEVSQPYSLPRDDSENSVKLRALYAEGLKELKEKVAA